VAGLDLNPWMPVPMKYRNRTNYASNGTNFSMPAVYQSSRTHKLSGGVIGVIVVAIGMILINAVAFFILRRRPRKEPVHEMALETETREKYELSGEDKVPEVPPNPIWELPEDTAILELPSTTVQEMNAGLLNDHKYAAAKKEG
jgi:hypothetical protein